MLLRAENAVSGVSEAGDDVGVFVQALVDGGDVDVDVGMFGLDFFNADGGGHEAHEADVAAAALLEHRNCVAGAAAGCQHGVRDYDEAVFNIGRELAIIDHGLVGFLIAVKADVAHLGDGDEGPEAVYHSEAGPEDGDDGELAAAHFLCGHLADWSLDLDVFQGEVTCDFVSHEERNLFQKLPEILGTGVFVSHDGQLVLNHGVVY